LAQQHFFQDFLFIVFQAPPINMKLRLQKVRT
jgi:hypothetical protein